MLDTAVYDAIGEEGFARLVRAFYKQVPGDEILGPMYPEGDFAGAEERLRDFLVQRFGGPERYMERRGHPRLRMRHAPFVVNQKGRDRWLELMEKAFAEAGLPAEVEGILRAFFEVAGTHMINAE